MSDDPVKAGHDFLNSAIRDKVGVPVPSSDVQAPAPQAVKPKSGGLAGSPGGRGGAPPRTTTYEEANAALSAGLRAAVRRKRGH